MNIAFFCIPAHGHTNPTLAVVRLGAREDDLSYERAAVKRCAAVGIRLRHRASAMKQLKNRFFIDVLLCMMVKFYSCQPDHSGQSLQVCRKISSRGTTGRGARPSS